MNSHRTCWVLTAIAAIAIAGCGADVERPDTYTVTGKVTLNGEAVEGAQVVFHAKSGPKAMGTTNSDGEYELTTFDSGDGCVAGSAKVTISKADTSGDAVDDDTDLDEAGDAYDKMMGEGGDSMEQKQLLPEAYADASTTPETREVKEGSNEFNFDLKN